ncbi:unnamed protein product, partial [Effrenium voratum]
QAEVKLHAAIVEEYLQEVSTLEEDVQGLQEALVDLARHTQAQNEMLDNISEYTAASSVAVAGATDQLTQASNAQRRGSSLLYWLLLFAAVLAAILIFVVVHKG